MVPEAKKISQIINHIMTLLRELLVRLCPAEWDELNLAESLNGLINAWNAHDGKKIHYQLTIKGQCNQLADPLPITIFRIVQESLTNIAKHSNATKASVTLDVDSESIHLIIEDNGNTDKLEQLSHTGIGLPGIRDRVTGLGGQLTLKINPSGGLIVQARLPIEFQLISETQQ